MSADDTLPRFSEETLQQLQRGSREVTFPRGSVLMAEGDPGTTMYLICSGRVSVLRDHAALIEPMVITELGPGEVVGEIALLTGQPRSATVVAIEDTTAFEITREQAVRVITGSAAVRDDLFDLVNVRLSSLEDLAMPRNHPKPWPSLRRIVQGSPC